MSGKRGRKRNDNLPPNRARDVQRAFRARRAAHLQALEQRVTELEEENNHLRAALNLPPAQRLPLGRGPTGKDRPKDADAMSLSRVTPSHSRESSSPPESPSPPRTDSVSPSVVAGPIRTSPRDISSFLDQTPRSTFDEPFDDEAQPSSSTSYFLPPVSTPMSQNEIRAFNFPPAVSSGQRNSIQTSIYLPHSQSSLSHTPSDRPTGASGYNDMNYLLRSARDETHHTYSYQQATTSDSQLSSSIPSHASPHSQPHTPQQRALIYPTALTNLPYPHKRSTTDPHAFRTQLPHLPNLAQHPQHPHGIKLPSPPRLHETGVPRPPAYNGPGSARV